MPRNNKKQNTKKCEERNAVIQANVGPISAIDRKYAKSGILQRYFKKLILSYKRAADPCYFSLRISIYVVASVTIFSLLFVY